MKNHLHFFTAGLFFLFLFQSPIIIAQCPAGSTRDTLNWDYLDFLPNSGSYYPTYISLAQSQTQRFTFGTQKTTVTNNYSGVKIRGENNLHTGQLNTYGSGADVQFTGDGTVTFSFQASLNAVKFSIYDIDIRQRITITAAANVVLTTLAGSVLTIGNNNTPAAWVNANSTTVIGNSANTPAANGTVNVDIAGPVNSFTITVTNSGTTTGEDGSYFISDISACSAGIFPNNYYIISKPFTGQPGYLIACRNDSIYYVNHANGKAKFLFADYGHNRINSVAYDPYRHMVYYAYSLSGPGGSASSTDRVLRRYDYDMDTLGIVCNDVRTLGIPLYDQSIESGAAAFYGGSLYLGVEGGSGSADRESSIWKIDFNSSYAPLGQAGQAFAVPSNEHDWSDMGINNGILYDFDGSTNTDFYHKNLLTGSVVNYTPSPSSLIPRQTGVDWNGVIYNIGSPGAIAAATIVPYNNNGTVNTAQQYNITFNGVAESGSWGDAGEAFKPKTDFGDAPASYDPAGSDPATHEKDDNLRLGNSRLIEWRKNTSADATGDGAEEDGLSGTQAISIGISNYLVGVKVFNRTGANATLAGWIDKNKDGSFQPGEGVSAIVPSNASIQTVNLLWSAINISLPAGTKTFLRLRLTSAYNGMTINNPTGYFDNGEVEDYLVNVITILPSKHLSLKAQKINDKHVSLNWINNEEANTRSYELQKSDDGNAWHLLYERMNTFSGSYSFIETEPYKPISFFRVLSKTLQGKIQYSETRKIEFTNSSFITINPNPANNIAELHIQSEVACIAAIRIYNSMGQKVYEQPANIIQGQNKVNLAIIDKLFPGTYKINVQLKDQMLVSSILVVK